MLQICVEPCPQACWRWHGDSAEPALQRHPATCGQTPSLERTALSCRGGRLSAPKLRPPLRLCPPAQTHGTSAILAEHTVDSVQDHLIHAAAAAMIRCCQRAEGWVIAGRSEKRKLLNQKTAMRCVCRESSLCECAIDMLWKYLLIGLRSITVIVHPLVAYLLHKNHESFAVGVCVQQAQATANKYRFSAGILYLWNG